eukprot:TRINITY_DN77_c0_g2_i3.p1 TRINITY_DN77_c0_g2~~TRINITY_DN77_c0_g2_i3.p1  ORF type:complete len:688 (-),score=219.79 TRINITY_DN77_c0_g2_i3:1008-3071(-)
MMPSTLAHSFTPILAHIPEGDAAFAGMCESTQKLIMYANTSTSPGALGPPPPVPLVSIQVQQMTGRSPEVAFASRAGGESASRFKSLQGPMEPLRLRSEDLAGRRPKSSDAVPVQVDTPSDSEGEDDDGDGSGTGSGGESGSYTESDGGGGADDIGPPPPESGDDGAPGPEGAEDGEQSDGGDSGSDGGGGGSDKDDSYVDIPPPGSRPPTNSSANPFLRLSGGQQPNAWQQQPQSVAAVPQVPQPAAAMSQMQRPHTSTGQRSNRLSGSSSEQAEDTELTQQAQDPTQLADLQKQYDELQQKYDMKVNEDEFSISQLQRHVEKLMEQMELMQNASDDDNSAPATVAAKPTPLAAGHTVSASTRGLLSGFEQKVKELQQELDFAQQQNAELQEHSDMKTNEDEFTISQLRRHVEKLMEQMELIQNASDDDGDNTPTPATTPAPAPAPAHAPTPTCVTLASAKSPTASTNSLLASYEQQVKVLRQDLDVAHKKQVDLERNNCDLQQEVGNLRATAEQAQEQHKAAGAACEQQADALQTEIESLRTELASRDRLLSERNAAVCDAVALATDYKRMCARELDDLKQKVRKRENMILLLRDKIRGKDGSGGVTGTPATPKASATAATTAPSPATTPTAAQRRAAVAHRRTTSERVLSGGSGSSSGRSSGGSGGSPQPQSQPQPQPPAGGNH